MRRLIEEYRGLFSTDSFKGGWSTITHLRRDMPVMPETVVGRVAVQCTDISLALFEQFQAVANKPFNP